MSDMIQDIAEANRRIVELTRELNIAKRCPDAKIAELNEALKVSVESLTWMQEEFTACTDGTLDGCAGMHAGAAAKILVDALRAKLNDANAMDALRIRHITEYEKRVDELVAQREAIERSFADFKQQHNEMQERHATLYNEIAGALGCHAPDDFVNEINILKNCIANANHRFDKFYTAVEAALDGYRAPHEALTDWQSRNVPDVIAALKQQFDDARVRIDKSYERWGEVEAAIRRTLCLADEFPLPDPVEHLCRAYAAEQHVAEVLERIMSAQDKSRPTLLTVSTPR